MFKKGDKVVVVNPSSDNFGRSFEVDSVDHHGIVRIKTPSGIRAYRPSSLSPAASWRKPPPPRVSPRPAPIKEESQNPPSETEELMRFFKGKKNLSSTCCFVCGGPATMLAYGVVCNTEGCKNFKP